MTTSKVRAYSNRDLFSPSSGGQKSEIKMWADLAPSGGPEGDPSCLFQLLVLLAFLDLWPHRSCLPPSSCGHLHVFVFSPFVSYEDTCHGT